MYAGHAPAWCRALPSLKPPPPCVCVRSTHPQPGNYDFSAAEAIFEWAVARGIRVRGHHLAGASPPDWVQQGNWTSGQMLRILTDTVTTVMRHFETK